VIRTVDPDIRMDTMHLENLWGFGMKKFTSNTYWELLDRFRQSNSGFSVLGCRFRDLFPSMWSYRPPPLPRQPHDEIWPPPPLLNEDVTHDMKLSVLTLTGRRLVSTQSGYIGLAPEAVPSGDVVAIIYGCNFPMLLRRHARSFKVTGKCYVDGLMDGEALRSVVELELC
jgi:hypothetical protein